MKYRNYFSIYGLPIMKFCLYPTSGNCNQLVKTKYLNSSLIQQLNTNYQLLITNYLLRFIASFKYPSTTPLFSRSDNICFNCFAYKFKNKTELLSR